MNEEHSGGDYSHKKELDQLEQKLVDLKGELAQAFEGTRGRSNGEIEEEIRQIEEKILEIEAQEDL
jgi:predicted nuclease of restriction endonuclease-like RecB superfamily